MLGSVFGTDAGWRTPAPEYTDKEDWPLKSDYSTCIWWLTRSAGYNYNICAESGITYSDFYDDFACAPTVHIREESLGVLVEECTVDKTAVDVGGQSGTRRGSGTRRAYNRRYISISTILWRERARMYKTMLPDEVATFTHTEVCNVPLRRYRSVRGGVSAGGAPMGASACAPDVQVSGVVEEEPGGGLMTDWRIGDPDRWRYPGRGDCVHRGVRYRGRVVISVRE